MTDEICYIAISASTGVPRNVRYAYEMLYSDSFEEASKEVRRLVVYYNLNDLSSVEVKIR